MRALTVFVAENLLEVRVFTDLRDLLSCTVASLR
jgi:hypothetical protein